MITLVFGLVVSTGIACAQAQETSPAASPAQEPTLVQQPGAPQAAPARHAMDPAKQAKHLGRKIGLSQDQVAQITPILADRRQQMQSLRADASLAAQDRRAKAQSIMQDSKAKLESVMNDQQKQKFEQMIAARRARRQAQGQGQAQPGL
jgi:hypothetical protein